MKSAIRSGEEVVQAPVRRIRDGRAADESDSLVAESPLEIRFEGTPFTVLMRTPGNDEELVAGFLFGEGIVDGAGAILELGHPESLFDGDCANVVDVRLDPARSASPAARSFYASASCGVCGKSSIADLEIRAPVVTSRLTVRSDVLERLPARLRTEQSVFEATGGLHGAALFDATGELLAAREDIGRHNAVDKLVGWALREERLPLSQTILVVTGRLGFEIVQKAIVAGIPIVGSVGAASSLAVSLAEKHGLTLAAFLRPGAMNIFGVRERVVAGSNRTV